MGLSAERERIAEIRLPPVLSAATIHVLAHNLATALAGPGRVVVFTGADGIFCHGLDLASVGADGGTAMAAFVDFLIELSKAAKPTLALIDGTAMGGGLGILSACDVALATDRSRFGLPEALYGFLPAAIFPVLLERLSMQKVNLLIVNGASQDALWAFSHGLIDDVVSADSIVPCSRRWARRLERTSLSVAIPELRRLCRQNRALNLEDSIRRGAAQTLAALSDPDRAERIRRFVTEGLAPWEVQ